MSNTRKWTCLVLEAMDEGILDAKAVAEMALAYMSESDVEDMCRANDLKDYLNPEPEEDDWNECADPDEALNDFNYVGSQQYH